MSDCLFCRIAAGEIPAKIVHQDDRYVAFEDIHPQAPVHVLIIPVRHVAGVGALSSDDSELVGGAIVLARTLAEKLGLSDRGFRLVLNTGAEAGQTVFHLHVHLLGGRPLEWPPG